MFGTSDRIPIGRVHDDDASHRGGRNIDVVDTHSRAADDPQSAGGIHQVSAHFRFAAHNKAFAISERLAQIFRPESSLFLNGKTSVAQWLEAGVTNFIGNENYNLLRRPLADIGRMKPTHLELKLRWLHRGQQRDHRPRFPTLTQAPRVCESDMASRCRTHEITETR